jgi:hypothetical protein
MKVEDEWLRLAMEAYWGAEGGTTGGLIAAIAAVAPLIAAKEREACAKVAEGKPWRPEKYGPRYRTWGWWTEEDNADAMGERAEHSIAIAAAIRARQEEGA